MDVQGHILVRRKARNGIDGANGEPGKDGKDGLQGCILRQSEWSEEGIEYRNDEALTSGTRYIDIAIVTTGANTFNAYKCLKTHTSSESIPVTNTTYWQKFNSLVPVYTPLIMAQNAVLRFMQGNQLLIMKSDNVTVAAGLVGGDYPLWVGATNPADAPFKVSIDGKLYASGAVISGDSTFEGELKGVTGSFSKLNCVDYDGNVVGGITFNASGSLWFSGDMYHQGAKEGRSLRFYTSDLWCRGTFGAAERNIMVVNMGIARIYNKGNFDDSTYVTLKTGNYNNETYYNIEAYSPRNDVVSDTAGFPVDIIVFSWHSTPVCRYRIIMHTSQRILVVNANDDYNNVEIYLNGSKFLLNNGRVAELVQLGKFMTPEPDKTKPGYGLMIASADYDNNWQGQQ